MPGSSRTDLRRAGDRFRTEAEGRATWHSFSFGGHYDPGNVGFGALVAHNEEWLPPGTGYPDHPHAATEIVTLVLSGALRHTDADGRTQVLPAGSVQRISAGTGIVHAEMAEDRAETTRFVQTWLRPDAAGGRPSYATEGAVSLDGGLVRLVGEGALTVGTRGAALYAGRLGAGVREELPEGPATHVFVAEGAVRLDGVTLAAGDAVRLLGGGGVATGGPEGALLVVWRLPHAVNA